jgi:hypothetical protein
LESRSAIFLELPPSLSKDGPQVILHPSEVAAEPKQ